MINLNPRKLAAIIASAALLTAVLAGTALAWPASARFALCRHVLGASGGAIRSDSFQLQGTWMPAPTGYASADSGTRLCAGFWLAGGGTTPSEPTHIHLPIVSRDSPSTPTGHPDLIVTDVQVQGNIATVTIKNQGSAPVADTFWVDLYLNPDPAPAEVNDVWSDGRCAQGMVWGVSESALPLYPGDTLTLTGGDAYYRPEHSAMSWPVPAGQTIYAQVDSAGDPGYGGVLESHEVLGGAYNNIDGPVLSLSGPGAASPAPRQDNSRPAAIDSLPPR